MEAWTERANVQNDALGGTARKAAAEQDYMAVCTTRSCVAYAGT